MVHRVPTREEQFYVSSLEVTAERVGEVPRAHWRVENGLQWGLYKQLLEEDGAAE